MEIEELIDESVASELRKLNGTPYDAKEYGAVSDTAVKLLAQKIEMEKAKNEQLMRERQLDDENRDRLIKNILSAAGIALPLLVTIWGTKVSLKFEEEGTFTTIMGRGFINKLLPKK